MPWSALELGLQSHFIEYVTAWMIDAAQRQSPMIVPDAVFGAAVIAGSSSVPPQLLTLTYSLSEIDRKQNTITVGSCRYSHFASYI